MRPVAIGGMAIMKLTAILMLLAMAVHATAQSNLMLGVAPLEPCWSVVVSPREWPREPGGSNTVIQCVAFVEGEVEKARSFLLTRSYRILEGGPKRVSPHVVVPYPGSASDTWTMFFAKDTLEPYSIERKGSTAKRYRIQLDPRSGI